MTTKSKRKHGPKEPPKPSPDSSADQRLTPNNNDAGSGPADPTRRTFLLNTGSAAAATVFAASLPTLANSGTEVLEQDTSDHARAVRLTLGINGKEHFGSEKHCCPYGLRDVSREPRTWVFQDSSFGGLANLSPPN